jgi:hypothetical protein
MHLSEQKMISLLREEFDERISQYLSEIETRDNNDNDLIVNAQGLKVKDKAGFVYTILKVIEKEGKIFVRLQSPEEARGGFETTSSLTPIYEVEGGGYDEKTFEKSSRESKKASSQEKVKSPETANSIIKRNPDAQAKRSFDADIEAEPAFDNYEMSDEEDVKSFDVEIKEFEREFTL